MLYMKIFIYFILFYAIIFFASMIPDEYSKEMAEKERQECLSQRVHEDLTSDEITDHLNQNRRF